MAAMLAAQGEASPKGLARPSEEPPVAQTAPATAPEVATNIPENIPSEEVRPKVAPRTIEQQRDFIRRRKPIGGANRPNRDSSNVSAELRQKADGPGGG